MTIRKFFLYATSVATIVLAAIAGLGGVFTLGAIAMASGSWIDGIGIVFGALALTALPGFLASLTNVVSASLMQLAESKKSGISRGDLWLQSGLQILGFVSFIGAAMLLAQFTPPATPWVPPLNYFLMGVMCLGTIINSALSIKRMAQVIHAARQLPDQADEAFAPKPPIQREAVQVRSGHRRPERVPRQSLQDGLSDVPFARSNKIR